MHISQYIEKFLRLPTDQHIDPEVRQHFRPNVINNALDGIIWLLGESFVSVNTILPVFASTLTSSAVLIGLVPALTNAGWFIPQLIMAGHVQRLTRKMPFAKAMSIVERLPYIFLPLTAYFLNWLSKDMILVFFLVVVAWRGIASGMIALPWQEVIATVIPPPFRSRFFGISRTFGRIMGVVGSGITTIILARFIYPNNYAVSFLIGGAFIWLSYFFFARTVEPNSDHKPGDNQPLSKQGIWNDFKKYKFILNRDSNFVRYLISRILFQLGSMAIAFFAVYGINNYQLADQQAAIFSGMMFFSATLGCIILGVVGDNLGPRKTLLISDVLLASALLLAFISPGLWSIYVIFLILGFAQSGYILGELIIAMELGPDDERPIYIGLARTLPGIFVLIAPLVGGMLIEQFSYRTMFLVALVFSLAGTAFLLGVKEKGKSAIPIENS